MALTVVVTGASAVAQVSVSAPWALTAYLCAEGDLARAGQRYAQGLADAAGAAGWSLALEMDSPAGAEGALRKALVPGAEGVVVSASSGDLPPGRGTAQALADFLSWAERRTPAAHRVLVVFGHGVSAGEPDGPGVAVDGGVDELLTPWELAQAVAVQPQRPDLIVLDVCHGASAEVIWDLRSAGDLVVASLGRMPAMGLAWAAILRGAAQAHSGEQVALACLGAARALGSGSLVAVRTGGLSAVAERLSALTAAVAADPKSRLAAVAAARSRCSDWGEGRELCDLRELCGHLGEARDTVLASRARAAAEAIDACTLGGAGEDGAGGLLAVLPGGIAEAPDGYDQRADGFAAASGWGRLLRLYCQRQQGLMRRVTGEGARGDGPA